MLTVISHAATQCSNKGTKDNVTLVNDLILAKKTSHRFTEQ